MKRKNQWKKERQNTFNMEHMQTYSTYERENK